MSGNMYVLAANNIDNSNKAAYDYFSFPYQNGDFAYISHDADEIMPEYIVMKQSDQTIRLKSYRIVFDTSGQEIIIPYQFLIDICPNSVVFENETVRYALNLNKFMQNGFYRCLVYWGSFFKIEIEIEDIDNVRDIELIGYKKIYDTPHRIFIRNNTKYTEIGQLLFQSETFYSREIEMNIDFNGKTNGFYIETSDNRSLERVKILLNGTEWLNLSYNILNIYCQKFSDKLWYLPFNAMPSMDGFDQNSWLNLTLIENVTLKISASQEIADLTIYSISQNFIHYQNGYIGLRYDYIRRIPSIKNNYKNIKGIFDCNEPIKRICQSEDLCQISLESIMSSEKYSECSGCQKNFRYENILEWLSLNESCPNCRRKWNDFQIYINE